MKGDFKGDFNMIVQNIHLHSFFQLYDLSTLINTPTYYQSQNPTCIDHFLTNRKTFCKLSQNFEIGLSDHYKWISAIMKSGSFNEPSRMKICRSYKTFYNENFNTALIASLDTVINNKY